MGNDMTELRQQILSNARFMICHTGTCTSTILPTAASCSTLVATCQQNVAPDDIEVVLFGGGIDFTGAVMVGKLTPAIQGAPAKEPELALRKLLTATCELLNFYMPKLEAHQRNIHGGGVYDEDLICPELRDAQRKAAASN